MYPKRHSFTAACAVALLFGALSSLAQTGDYLYSGTEQTITLNPGLYDITAYGAQGGSGGAGGGLGAEMGAQFDFGGLTSLTLLVGGSGGGGGGSFVINGSIPLVISGGGGGGGAGGGNGGAGNVGTSGVGGGSGGSGGGGYKGGGSATGRLLARWQRHLRLARVLPGNYAPEARGKIDEFSVHCGFYSAGFPPQPSSSVTENNPSAIQKPRWLGFRWVQSVPTAAK